MKMKMFHKIKYDLNGHIEGCVIFFSLTFRSAELITTLTSVLINNFFYTHIEFDIIQIS